MSIRHVTKCQQSSRRVPIFIDGDKRPLGITLQFSLMINVRHPELLFLIWLWLTLYTCSFSHVHQYLVLYVAIKTKIQNQKKYVHVLYLSNNIIGTWKKIHTKIWGRIFIIISFLGVGVGVGGGLKLFLVSVRASWLSNLSSINLE